MITTIRISKFQPGKYVALRSGFGQGINLSMEERNGAPVLVLSYQSTGLGDSNGEKIYEVDAERGTINGLYGTYAPPPLPNLPQPEVLASAPHDVIRIGSRVFRDDDDLTKGEV